MSGSIGPFERVFTLGGVRGGAGPAGEPLFAPELEHQRAPLPVRRIVAAAVQARAGTGRALVVTSQLIEAHRTAPLFGYADRRRGVAVVSTARLALGEDPGGGRRLENVIRHETGHLDGLRHCRTPGCLMQAAESVADLDARRDVPCGRCPRERFSRPGLASATLLLACGLLFSGLDAVADLIKPASPRPFSCAAVAGSAAPRLLFNGVPLRGGADVRARPLPCLTASAAALNDLFNRRRRPPLQVVSRPDGAALLVAGGTPLLLVAPGAESGSATVVARSWADDLQRLLRAKGSAAEGCPQCHVNRPVDMWYAARLRKGG